jgi:glycosyltransferase involved in cell wall biosynthesis
MAQQKLSVVVPCYNEEGNIPLIINRFKEVIGDNPDIEVVLVNNGSTDNSVQVFDAELKKVNDPRFRLALVKVNQGYGFGILSGLKEATGDILGWTHADMQTDPKDVVTAYHMFLDSNEENLFVKGKRKNRRFAEAFFTWGMQVICTVVLKTPLSDINAQPKMFRRSFYNKHFLEGAPYDFSLDLYALYWAKRECVIKEIPVYFNKRIHGEAKGGGSFKTRKKLIKRTFNYIFALSRQLKESTTK